MVRLREACAWVIQRSLWLWLGAALLAFLLPEAFASALSILALCVLLAWVAGKGYRLPALFLFALLVLFVAGLVSLAITPDPEVTRWPVARLWAGLALSYGLVAWSVLRARPGTLEVTSAAMGVGLALLGALIVRWPGGSKLPFIPKTLYAILPIPAQGIINANMLGGALVALLPLVWASVLWAEGSWRWLKRMLFGVSALVILAVLVLTQTRGALLAALVTLGVLTVARWPRLVFLLWPVALVAGWGIANTGLDAFLSASGADSAISGLSDRVDLWQRALLMLRDFPLTGPGAGLYERLMWALYPPTQLRPGLSSGLHAHNIWLQVGVDFGLPGLFAFVV